MDQKTHRPGSREQESRSMQNIAGENRGKTRPDVPSTRENNAATGKRVRRSR